MREIAIFYVVLTACVLLAVACSVGMNWAAQFGEAAKWGGFFVVVFIVVPPAAWLIAALVDRWL